jgi:hypothetical protein
VSFEVLANVTAIAAFLLAMGWLFAGSVMIKRWSREPNEIALVIGRRIGGVYLGIAVLFFLSRSTNAAELIDVLSITGMFINTLLAGLGIFEFIKRRIGAAIFLSVAVEILLLLGFGRLVLG